MPANYASTEVSVSKSQTEVRAVLRRFGSGQFTMGEGDDWAGVEFVHNNMRIRMKATARPYSAERSPHKRRLQPHEWPEQEQKRIWRVLRWTLEARLVAVDEELETFEQAFLPYIVDPITDRTVWEAMREPIEAGALQLGGSGLRALGTGDG